MSFLPQGTHGSAMVQRLGHMERAEPIADPPEIAALNTAIQNVRICARNGAWNAGARATVLDQITRAFTEPR